MKVLVTGGTGLLGRELCKRLAADGHELVLLTRRPKNAEELLPAARAFRWDPEVEPSPAEAWEGVDAVVHLAGEPVADARWTTEQKRRIRDSRVIGTQNLIAGIKGLSSKPKVLVSASAVGYYGSRGDELLLENSAPGTGFLSETCIDWENQATRAQEFGLRVVRVRIGVVLSPEGGAMKTMMTPFKLGLGGRLGPGTQWFPWIHIDDIVGIINFALKNDAISGPVNGAAPGIVDNDQFTRAFAGALNRPVFFPVPEFALRIMMGEMADVVLNSQKVAPKAALDAGYQFRFPELKDALKNLLN